MMAGIPKVKIEFDADLDGLKKGTADADKEVGGFADKVSEFGKKAAAAFAVAAAAAAAYAVKLAVDGVKAAIEDEQAQLKLASALEKATGATDAQIKAIEDQILKTSLATGVADDKLRPALQRLAIATGDTEEAQKLLNLALDISTATGKPLETVSNALGKAYEGNTTALAKLNAGISTADANTLGYTGAVQKLTDLYGGAAAANADTFQGRIDRVKVAFDETKESIGAALLPILEKLLGFITDTILPVFQRFSDALSGSGDGILGRFTDIYNYIRDFVEPIFDAVRAAFVRIGDAIKNQNPRFQEIIKTFEEIWTWIDKYIVPALQFAFVAAIESFAQAAVTAIKVVVPVAEAVFKSIKEIINLIIGTINQAINVYNLANNIFGGKDIKLITKVGEGGSSSGKVGGVQIPFGGANVGGVSGGGIVVGGRGGGGIVVGGGGGGGGGGGKIKPEMIDWDKELADALDNFSDGLKLQNDSLKTLEGLSFEAAQRARLGLPPLGGAIPNNFDVARFRAGEEKDRNVINLTVNGAVDPESTARQIVTILNDSQARGTLGASGFAGSIAS